MFDYIFDRCQGYPASTEANPGKLSKEVLDELRGEFMYWYPVDIRVSGHDLIRNHLIFALFNHAAVWPEKPQYWPKSYYCNGHVLVNVLI